MGFRGRVPTSSRNYGFFFRGRVPKSSVNYGFSEEGCYVKDIVHERARLSAVVQCSGVCEATALAQRSGGQ